MLPGVNLYDSLESDAEVESNDSDVEVVDCNVSRASAVGAVELGIDSKENTESDKKP
jgi:hypothetical protein